MQNIVTTLWFPIWYVIRMISKDIQNNMVLLRECLKTLWLFFQALPIFRSKLLHFFNMWLCVATTLICKQNFCYRSYLSTQILKGINFVIWRLLHFTNYKCEATVKVMCFVCRILPAITDFFNNRDFYLQAKKIFQKTSFFCNEAYKEHLNSKTACFILWHISLCDICHIVGSVRLSHNTTL